MLTEQEQINVCVSIKKMLDFSLTKHANHYAYIVIEADGKACVLCAKQQLAYKTLHKIVGGYIQLVPTVQRCLICCDEEGRLKGKPSNAFDPNFVGTIVISTRSGFLQKGE